MHISFEHDNCQLNYPNGAVFNITQRGRLYYLKNIVSARNATYNLHTWHKILGHYNQYYSIKLPNLVKGMKIKPTPNYVLNCDKCIQGKKMSNDRNKTLDWKATKILAIVHSDLADTIQPLAKDGYKYVNDFIDHSGFTILYFLKHKSDTLLATMKYLTDITPNGHVKCLRTDIGTDFASEPFQKILVLNKIKHEQKAPYSPHQNGTNERPWWTLFSTTSCLFIESKGDKNLWVYTLMNSVNIKNRCYYKNTRQTHMKVLTV